MELSQTPVYVGAIIIAISGAFGATVNSALIHFKLVQAANQISVSNQSIKLTCWINVIAGVAAALLSWGLYGPVTKLSILGTMDQNLLTISSIAGAIMVGYSGSSWLTTHADKQEWQKNTQMAINLKPNDSTDKLAGEIPTLGPTEASKKIRSIEQ
jgi:hypothetical protein